MPRFDARTKQDIIPFGTQPADLRTGNAPATVMPVIVNGSVGADQLSCQVLVVTAAGAASQLASQLALALRPDVPDSLSVLAPPDPQAFRQELEQPVKLLAVALSTVVMIMGAIAIGTSLGSSVTARIGEIGLRMALGARPRHILAQLVAESTIVGAIGSTIGAIAGTYVVVLVGITNSWTPILNFTVAVWVCLGGGLIGALAGLVPAVRAARMSPIASLAR